MQHTFINDQDSGPQPAGHCLLILLDPCEQGLSRVRADANTGERMDGNAAYVAGSNAYHNSVNESPCRLKPEANYLWKQ